MILLIIIYTTVTMKYIYIRVGAVSISAVCIIIGIIIFIAPIGLWYYKKSNCKTGIKLDKIQNVYTS